MFLLRRSERERWRELAGWLAFLVSQAANKTKPSMIDYIIRNLVSLNIISLPINVVTLKPMAALEDGTEWN